MDKRWAIVEGFDGAYRVSDAGDVESCHVPGARRRGSWRPLKISKDKYGYPLTYLWDSSRQVRVRIHVHKLVALSFVENPLGLDCVNPVLYAADGQSTQWGECDATDFGPWGKTRASIHMPHWASRITLEITGVRVERLNDINEADAIAEGVTAVSSGGVTLFTTTGVNCFQTAKDAYAALWESINGPGSWEANPWVWVVEFRRIER